MQTPNKIKPIELLEEIHKFYLENTDSQGQCLICREFTEIQLVYFSLHNDLFDDLCAGEGQVWRLSILYCPKCEDVPEEQGCIHLAIR